MISVFGSKVGPEEIKNVVECMASQWMGFGGNVEKFEQKFCDKFGLQNFVMVDSGSNALYMAIVLLELPPGSEIILPSFTWVSCAQAVILAGHTPVFCDVELGSMNISRQHIEPHITDKTAAIMIVDYAGLPVDIEPIKELGFPIIEDAAHAVYSLHKGVPCGKLADVAIYSFDAVKNLTVGEGGGVLTQDAARSERAKMLRYCGIGKSGFDKAISSAQNSTSKWWEYNIKEPFIKMLPTNLAAGIGLAQLDKIDELQAIRQQIWDYYQDALGGMEQITIPMEAAAGDRHSYFTYAIRAQQRDRLAKYLLDNQIYTTLRYHPLHLNNLYKQTAKRLVNCEILNEDCLSIPLHPRLSMADAEYVVAKIRDFYKT